LEQSLNVDIVVRSPTQSLKTGKLWENTGATLLWLVAGVVTVYGWITNDMYEKKLKEYKEKQEDLLLQMEDHNKADENFYITAATVLDLSSRALEIFRSSEVNEKRALLKFLLQNCVLNGRKLLFELKTPFDVIAQYGKTQNWLPGLDDVDNK